MEKTTTPTHKTLEVELREIAAARPPYSADTPVRDLYLTLVLEAAARDIEALKATNMQLRAGLHQLLALSAPDASRRAGAGRKDRAS